MKAPMQPLRKCVCHCSYKENLLTFSKRTSDNFQFTNLFLHALIIHNHHIQQEWKQLINWISLVHK